VKRLGANAVVALDRVAASLADTRLARPLRLLYFLEEEPGLALGSEPDFASTAFRLEDQSWNRLSV
jgi:hypothetical protein